MVRRYPILLFLLLTGLQGRGQYRSKIIHHDPRGRLVYLSDHSGNRIPDFSQAGYLRGDSAIPRIPVVAKIKPVPGNNSIRIQKVLDSLAALPADAKGFRGMVLLFPGRYDIYEPIKISASGIVLQGAGDGQDETRNTVLIGKGKDFGSAGTVVLVAGNAASGWKDEIDGTRTRISSEFIPVGSRTFRIDHPKAYRPGDEIVIFHPCTQKWIDFVDGGGTDTDPSWMPGEVDVFYKRQIIAIKGNQVTIDIPVYNHLDKGLSQSFVYKYNPKGILRNVGVENMRIDIANKGGEDEEHTNYGVFFSGVQDCWAKKVSALHFVRAGFITTTADRVTIDSCQALEPVSKIIGERRYNFCVAEYSNNILFSNCRSTEARHSFVSNGCGSASGIVFMNSTADINHTASESHRMWSQGMLFENIKFTDNRKGTALALYNRGSFGVGHGWSAVHSVAWNCRVLKGRIVIQKPPGGQNYAICSGDTVNSRGPFVQPEGYIEGTGKTPLISSLFDAQLKERQGYGIMPDAPARLKLVMKNSRKMLIWDDIAADEESYVIEGSEDGVKFHVLGGLKADSTFYPIVRNSRYYRAYALSSKGRSAYSNVVE